MAKYFKSFGSEFWTLDDKKHREDGPAVISETAKEWWINGLRHREDGPAIEMHNGSKLWYRNGLHHREDGPAVELSNGLKEWWVNGKRHRLDGPAYSFMFITEWWVNNKLHRTDGPAVESLIRKEWRFEGMRHRDDGPAILNSNLKNEYDKSWWLFDKNCYTEEIYEAEKNKYRKDVESILYNDIKICRDLSRYVSSFVI